MRIRKMFSSSRCIARLRFHCGPRSSQKGLLNPGHAHAAAKRAVVAGPASRGGAFLSGGGVSVAVEVGAIVEMDGAEGGTSMNKH